MDKSTLYKIIESLNDELDGSTKNTVKQLVQRTGITNITIFKYLSDMEKNDLIIVKKSKPQIISLTEKGKNLKYYLLKIKELVN